MWSSMRGSPPLARGVQSENVMSPLINRITPACAGSTFVLKLSILLNLDHPRLRGEYKSTHSFQVIKLGSPPLARGVRIWKMNGKNFHRITPACAGSTKSEAKEKHYDEDHPRLRGEY